MSLREFKQAPEIDRVSLKTFRGDGYEIQIPTNWLVIPTEMAIAFAGPKVGKAKAGFLVEEVPNQRNLKLFVQKYQVHHNSEGSPHQLL